MRYILVFDIETTTDTVQSLTFGCFRIYELRANGTVLGLVEEGLIHDDDLPERDPKGYAVLRTYATAHRAPVDHRVRTLAVAVGRLQLMPRTEFVEHVLWRRAYRYRMGIVGFNLPFDLSRIAIGVAPARGFHDGGFSFKLWDRDHYRPRLLVKHLDSRKSFISWGTTPQHHWRGVFIDCRTLAFGLSNRGHSLESACQAFGVPGKAPVSGHGVITSEYVDYCRQDVEATAGLYDALVKEFRGHPIDTEPHQVYSPATLVKGYFDAMGIEPLWGRTSVPDELLGATMSTFYGGRAECRIRRQLTPVTVLDYTSMYPTVGHLMGLWDLITASDIVVEEITLDLSQVDITHCLQPAHWREFAGIAQILPDQDIVPVRARYGPDDATNIGVNHFSAPEPKWYAIPDLVASRILTGKAPRILQAYRFRSTGRSPSLQPVSLLGRIPISPERDFFKYAVEERQRVKESDPKLAELLKTMANSGSYGIFAQVNKKRMAKPVTAQLFYRDGVVEQQTAVLEAPGKYFYPPLATLPTAGARLMLALLEAMVLEAGGYWAFMDTDSCAVTGADPDAIIRRIDPLNPYDRALVPHLLKREFDGYAYVISAKRYALLDDAGRVVKTSQHGLGYLLSPTNRPRTDWIHELWSGVVHDGAQPDWLAAPAVMPYTVSSWTLYDSFRGLNDGKPYAEQVKPFNFMLIGTVNERWNGPRDALLMAPYESAPRNVKTWVDKHNPAASYVDPPLKTFRDVVNEYVTHPEYKFETLDGEQCGPHTVGYLRRQWVYAPATRVIGKESNTLEGPALFELDDIAPVLLGKTWPQWLELVAHFFDRCTRDKVMSERQMRRYLAGEQPKPAKMRAIIQACTQYALADLKGHELASTDPSHILQTWYHVMHGDPGIPF
ncbi:hypothetical protein ACPCTO_03290 [Streptomyces olivoreticuli]